FKGRVAAHASVVVEDLFGPISKHYFNWKYLVFEITLLLSSSRQSVGPGSEFIHVLPGVVGLLKQFLSCQSIAGSIGHVHIRILRIGKKFVGWFHGAAAVHGHMCHMFGPA